MLTAAEPWSYIFSRSVIAVFYYYYYYFEFGRKMNRMLKLIYSILFAYRMVIIFG